MRDELKYFQTETRFEKKAELWKASKSWTHRANVPQYRGGQEKQKRQNEREFNPY